MSIELLLQADLTKLKRPEKEVKIKRLSELFGGAMIFKLRAVSTDEVSGLQNMTFNVQEQSVDISELQIQVVLAGIIEPELKNAELLAHFGVPTPKELLMKLLSPGEIKGLYDKISDLSGYGKDSVEDVKN